MKIGDASLLSGCHIETIRYYERVGLLAKPARGANGYRSYTQAGVARLRFIARGRELGFSLDEIRSLLSLAEDPALSCAEVDQLARRHLQQIETKLLELSGMASALRSTISGCAGGDRAHCAILEALAKG